MSADIVKDKDGQFRIRMPYEKKDRSEYQKKYYQEHRIERKIKNYNAQVQYLKWIDVKKAINGLKRQIGDVNYELVMNEINKLERTKH